MTKFIAKQFSQSTGDDARDYFSGTSQSVAQADTPMVAPGTYRVVNGELRRVVGGIPPELASDIQSPPTDKRTSNG